MPYIMTFILQTWTFCFAGDLLINWVETSTCIFVLYTFYLQSLEIPNEIFYTDWSKDFAYKNPLGKIIAMKRGQRSVKLTLGGFGSLDLESFMLVKKKFKKLHQLARIYIIRF